jgi:hypothetical protein
VKPGFGNRCHSGWRHLCGMPRHFQSGRSVPTCPRRPIQPEVKDPFWTARAVSHEPVTETTKCVVPSLLEADFIEFRMEMATDKMGLTQLVTFRVQNISISPSTLDLLRTSTYARCGIIVNDGGLDSRIGVGRQTGGVEGLGKRIDYATLLLVTVRGRLPIWFQNGGCFRCTGSLFGLPGIRRPETDGLSGREADRGIHRLGILKDDAAPRPRKPAATCREAIRMYGNRAMKDDSKRIGYRFERARKDSRLASSQFPISLNV